LPAFTADADVFAGTFTVFAAVLAAGFAPAFAATGFVFEALLDFADFEADFAADFFDEALAMASRRCMSETAAALHHGCAAARKRRSAKNRVFNHEPLQIVTYNREFADEAANL
jgi:hypothetical protein